MRRFVKRVILFAAILTGIVGGIGGLEIACEIRAYREALRAPTTADTVVCSASKSEKGLNPARWPGLFNFCASGRPLDQVYLVSKDLFAANPGRFRHYILELSPESVRDDTNVPVDRMGFAAQYYLLYLLHWSERVRPLDGIVKVCRDNLVGRRLREFSKAVRGRKKFRGALGTVGFTPSARCGALTDPVWFQARVQRMRLECDRGLDTFGPGSTALAFSDRIIDLARTNGAEVVIFSSPMHRDLIKACGPDRIRRFSKAVAAYAEEKGCRYLDLSELDLPDDCWVDGNHVNSKGAETLTAHVRDFVTKASGTGP